MKLYLQRTRILPTRTFGYMIAGTEPFGYTLEDVVRNGDKIPGETAIPAGEYRVTLYDSPKFKRILPMLHDVQGFSHILIHGGNTERDTEGCILVARKRIGFEKIYESLSSDLVRLLSQDGGVHTIRIQNP